MKRSLVQSLLIPAERGDNVTRFDFSFGSSTFSDWARKSLSKQSLIIWFTNLVIGIFLNADILYKIGMNSCLILGAALKFVNVGNATALRRLEGFLVGRK